MMDLWRTHCICIIIQKCLCKEKAVQWGFSNIEYVLRLKSSTEKLGVPHKNDL